MKKIIVFAMTLMFALIAFSGCKNPNQGMVGDAYLLTIYRARSSGMRDGVDDNEVAKALEDKFFKDKGIKIKLEMRMYTNNDLPQQVDLNFPNTNQSMEAVIHYLSEDVGSAITKYAKEEDATIDLDPYLEQYGQHILEKIRQNDTDHLSERAGYFPIGDTYKRNALTSFEEEGGFAILVRKDYMRQVKTITGLDPEDYDILNENYENMTVHEFEQVMRAIKNNVDGIQYPVSGYPWDLTRVIATAFGVDGWNYGVDSEGNFVPPQFMLGYERFIDLMYRWSKDGVWETDSTAITEETRLTKFVAGQSAAFLCYPEAKQLIRISKTFYEANPGAELMVIAPLANNYDNGDPVMENGERQVFGNLKSPRAFSGLIVPFKAKNTEILIKFIDWLYENPENYDLAKYGIKGKHWIEGPDKTVGGKTYKTWAYPDAKASQYLVNPPYSGMWDILPNINVSNRISAHYNTVETKWYATIYHSFPTFSNTDTEGIWLPSIPRELAVQAQDVDGKFVENVRGKAWAGILGEGGKTPKQLLQSYITDVQNADREYFDFLTQSYNKANAFLSQKFGS